MSENPETPKVKSIARLYYSNPAVKEAIFEFAKKREVVPRYYEGFGKRPDTLQYPDDIQGLVNKGATSFHASEEIWTDPLEINSEMSQEELSSLRDSWDLLIDIDSPYLDYSKIAARLIISELENYGIKSYGLKFSGSKGFHIIVPAKAFPENFNGVKTKLMFPEWPRAISEYLMNKIKPFYNKEVGALGINFQALKERTNLSKEDVVEMLCPNCNSSAKKTNLVFLECNRCGNKQIKPNYKITKRALKCIEITCPGAYEIKEEKELFSCENCSYSSLNKLDFKTKHMVVHTPEAKKLKFSEEFKEEVSASKLGSLDLVLVSSRHLFRMPYSLHEKTSLASIVLDKSELQAFSPKDAGPLKVKIKDFYKTPNHAEALSLLSEALKWKSLQEAGHEKESYKKYEGFQETDFSNITEEMFPKPIKKLLKGLTDGRKRGLFVLITFLRSSGFSADYINKSVRDWNKKNSPPLKEGYIKSQIEWHLKQKKKILPPNYSNQSFYRDLKLLDSEPKFKNPLAELSSIAKRQKD